MTKELTGRRRYRIGGLLRTKLILQVECCWETFDRFGHRYQRLYWRDATTKDLMIIPARCRPHPLEGEEQYPKR